MDEWTRAKWSPLTLTFISKFVEQSATPPPQRLGHTRLIHSASQHTLAGPPQASLRRRHYSTSDVLKGSRFLYLSNTGAGTDKSLPIRDRFPRGTPHRGTLRRHEKE